jgi:hypothetical protein
MRVPFMKHHTIFMYEYFYFLNGKSRVVINKILHLGFCKPFKFYYFTVIGMSNEEIP